MCQKVQFFICEDSEHLGIVWSDITNNEKKALGSQISFSVEHGCGLLYQFMVDGDVVWFGNHDFTFLVKQLLYDVTCPGLCDALSEMKLPDAENVTVCQLTEVSAYMVASQITWVTCLLIIIRHVTDPS